jgi:ribonuclease E
VSSVALQVLRNLEETLMKGATHNLTVRTRTDVALYVLNHKRGHLRDLETSFKVSLAVLADSSIGGQQSFVIERGEQVHTLEAAKALLAAQVAAAPSSIEDAFDDDEAFETEAEVETDETEGLADDQVAAEHGDAAEGESDDGHRRKRRRRRRGRPGEARDSDRARDDADAAVAAPESDDAAQVASMVSDSGEVGSEEQENEARSDQGDGSERRPRRRGRRGGRRRRGGPDEGLAGSIADELAPTSAPEVASAVADFDGEPPAHDAPVATVADEARPSSNFNGVGDHQPEAVHVPQPEANEAAPAVQPPAPEEATAETEKSARRRSTVREKVSFAVEEPLSPPPAAESSLTTPAPVEPTPPAAVAAPEPAAPAAGSETPPRRAGWWSRRFGSGS